MNPLDQFKQAHPEYKDASNSEAGRAMYNMYYKDSMDQGAFVKLLSSKIKASDNTPYWKQELTRINNTPNGYEAPPQKEEPSVLKDMATQIPAGIARGALNTSAALNDIAATFEGTVPLGGINVDASGIHYTPDMTQQLTADSKAATDLAGQMPKAETLPGAITGVLAQFIAPYAGASKAITSANAAKNIFVKGMAAGATSDFLAFDPHEKRLSNLLTEMDNPALNNVVTQYLSADKEDSNLEGRLKQVLEGGLVGMAAEPIVRGLANSLRWIKGARQAKSERAATEAVTSEAAQAGETPIKDVMGPSAEEIAKGKKVIFTHVASDAPKVDNLNMSKYPMRPTTKGFMEAMDKYFGTPVPKRSFPENDSIAMDLGLTPNDIIDISKQTDNLDSTLFQAHNLLTDGVRELKLQADKIRGGLGTEDDLIKFVNGIKELSTFQDAVKRMTASAGRQLNILKRTRSAMLSNSEDLDSFLQGKKVSREHIQAVAEAMSEATTVGQARRMARKFIEKPTRVDAVLELYVNSLLSGVRTHVTNVASTGTSILWTLPERYVAAGIGATRKALGSKGTDFATLKEANAYAMGFLQGGRDAFGILGRAAKDAGKSFKDAYKTGGKSLLKDPEADLTHIKVGKKILTDPLGKLELEKHQAFRGDVILGEKAADKYRKTARTIDILGEWTVRLPGRALYLGDSMMKTMGYRMELNAAATRKAMGEVKAGKLAASKVDDRIKELFDSAVQYGMELPEKIAKDEVIFKELHDHAMENGARYLTFTRQLGSVGRAIQHATSHPVMRSIVPFVRTPINILKFTGERTPFALASPAVRKEIAKLDAKSDVQMARLVFGSLAGFGVYEASKSGYFTGSFPDFDPEKKQRYYDVGLQPNAFVDKQGWIGKPGEVYSLSRLEPVATIFGIAADMAKLRDYMTDQEAEYMGSLIVASVSQNMTNKTYLKTLTDLASVVQDPDRNLMDFAKNYLSSIATAPIGGTMAAHIAQQQDPYLKDAQTLAQAIMVRIPYMRGDVPNRVNDYGEDIKIGKALGPNIMSPIFKSKITDSELKKQVWKLGVNLSDPSKKIDGVDLTQQQYNRMRRIAGKNFNDIGSKLVKMWGPNVPDGVKTSMLRDVWTQSNQIARGIISAEIIDERIKSKVEQEKKLLQ